MFKRALSITLILLHLATFGPMREAAAFFSSGTSYNLNADVTGGSSAERAASGSSSKIQFDAIGQPCAGESSSTSYVLSAGFISVIQSNPPALSGDIGDYESWPLDSVKESVFDLDDYFASPENYPLTYTVSGNSSIKVTIDPGTHMVSFSAEPGFSGAEKVHFIATDNQGNTAQSGSVTLQVTASSGQPNKPVIIGAELSPLSVKEGDIVTLTVQAADPDGQALTFSYSEYFIETKTWQENGFWYSQASWQAPEAGRGHYPLVITVKDTAGLSDTEDLVVNIGNFNHAPVLSLIADVSVNEGDIAVIQPSATDADNDALNYYYSAPFDSQGKWMTGYDDDGLYNITVTASDGIDIVSQNAKVIVNHTNRPPHVNLTLSKYTVKPNEQFDITVSVADPDGDAMTFVLTKDGSQIASGAIRDAYSAGASFPDLGDHNISVTVTDSGGKSSTDTKGVDVADPNANRDAINPVMGDFNGDALSDLGLHNSDTGAWEVCISDKGVFRNAVEWLKGFGTSRDWWPIGGDFNGDAKTDAAIYNITSGELKIATSGGASFSDQGIWLKFDDASYAWQPFTGNFNADKYTDFAVYNKDTGEVRVALGTRTGFQPFQTWISGFGNGYAAFGGDFNADGLTDLCLFKKSGGEFKVAFSNSKAFVDGSVWLSGFAADKDALISDFNNDGLADVGYWDKDNGRWYYAISTGEKFIDKGVWLDNFGSTSDESATTGDFDANGITDAAVFDKDLLGINRWKTQLSTNKPADLLNLIDNGIGGQTKVTYTYAAASENGLLPFPVYVVSKISLINTYPADRAATYTQEFSFSGGYYDAGEREFRGFAKVKVTDPVTKNYTETYFYQGRSDSGACEGDEGAKKGQIWKIHAYDGNKHPISEVVNNYTVQKAGPEESFLGFPALTGVVTTVYEENGESVTTKDNLIYDNIGNVIEALSLGDASKTGDERSTAIAYSQSYELGFNRPLETALKDKDGNIVSKKAFEYDTKGNLIKDTVFVLNPLTGSPANSLTQYSYDSFGNLVSTTNALGNAVTTDYETDFYTYPRKVANSLGHTLTYIYDPKFGAVKEVTDANGATTTTSYDALGRPTQVQNALGEVAAAYTYAADFHSKTTANALGLFKTEYIDGLGRKYKSVSSGEDGASQRNVFAETFFNNRGLTEKESLPHYIDEDPGQIAYTRREYDIRGRVKKTIADFLGTTYDAEATVSYISPLYTETTDPLGHRKGTVKDVYGNIIEVKEFVSTEPEAKADGAFRTYYEYDIQNNLTKTTDNKGNVTQIFYDSIGRKTKMIDPDMGTWAYEYDAIGNLIRQTDAKRQVLVFEYDKINRLVKKSLRGASAASDEAIAEYFYDDSSKDNCIGRLSKVKDKSGSTEFFYDKLGREIKSIKSLRPATNLGGEAIYTVQREYDVLDRLTKLTYPDGEIVSYAYDSNSGLLERVYTNDGIRTTNDYIKDITYNAKGQIRSTQYGNKTQTTYAYGSDLRLSNIRTTNDEQRTTLQDLVYKFDKNGNVTSLTDNISTRRNTREFRYDGLDRLIEEQKDRSPISSYQYDSIGNMTYKSDVGTMVYGQGAGPHAVTTAGGTYKYDLNGNMTQNRNKILAYDAENRLTQVTDGSTITSFVYDGDGGRVKKTSSLRGAAGDEAISTEYIGSLFEKDSEGTIRKHIFAGSNRVATHTLRASAADGADGILRASEASREDTVYFHGDHLGSSNVITDAGGNQVQYCEYAPYGTTTTNTVIASPEGAKQSPTNYLFTGKELDNTGLYFYGARYYDPIIGRFITADTIVQAPYDSQSLNRYAYCRNNPLKYIDPSGHLWWWVIPAIIGAIIGGASAAITGGNIGLGILTGALSGVLFAGAGMLAEGMKLTRLATAGMYAAAGAISGTAGAGITGGNVGIGALTGAFGGALGYGSSLIGGPLGLMAGLTSGAAAGGLGSVMLGGDFGEGAWRGAAAAGIAYSVTAAAGYASSKAGAVKQAQERKIADLQGMIDEAYGQEGVLGSLAAINKIAAQRMCDPQMLMGGWPVWLGTGGRIRTTAIEHAMQIRDFGKSMIAFGKSAGDASLYGMTVGFITAGITPEASIPLFIASVLFGKAADTITYIGLGMLDFGERAMGAR